MTVTTIKGNVQFLSADGQPIAVNAGTQASVPGSGQATPIAANNPAGGALASLSASIPTTQQLLTAAVADAKTNPVFAAATADAGDARAGSSAAENLILASDGLADSLANTDTAAGGNAAGTATAAGGGGGGGGGGAVSAAAGAGSVNMGSSINMGNVNQPSKDTVAGLVPTTPQSPSSP